MPNAAAMLPPPALYFPPLSGTYEVTPGLRPFGTDFGNGEVDGQLFQIDSEFDHYRVNKFRGRRENMPKYVAIAEYAEPVAVAVHRLIVERLTQEHPRFFELRRHHDGSCSLDCHLTKEALHFDNGFRLNAYEPSGAAYVSGFDALACQVQEDMAVWRMDAGSGREWLSAIHLCAPNHWAAADKIGRPFAQVHAPVAGMDKTNNAAAALVETMVQRGPFVRFAWGIATDLRLNHHPEAPHDAEQETWAGRRFDPERPHLFVRIERQTLWPLPKVSAALFTIRTYFRDCQAVKQHPAQRAGLLKALRSMSPEALRYKGLEQSIGAILKWLED